MRARLWQVVRQSWLLIIIVLLFLGVGAVWGTWAAGSAGVEGEEVVATCGRLMAELNGNLLAGSDFWLTELKEKLLTVGAMYFLGLTAIGFPLILVILMVQGYIWGFTIALFWYNMQYKGLLFVLPALLPHNVIYLPVLLMGGVAALSFSALLWQRYINPEIQVWAGWIGYTLLMLLLSVLAVVAVGVEVFVTPALCHLIYSLFSLLT